MGSTDWAGHECINHFYGPPLMCCANRFYDKTECNPPRFWKFSTSLIQTETAWLFLNTNEWLEYDRHETTKCQWQWEVNFTGNPNQLTARLEDNDGSVVPITTNAFRLHWIISYEPPVGLPAFFDRYFYFGPPGFSISRSTGFSAISTSWKGRTLNDPTIPAPRGTLTMVPKLCQLGWSPTQPGT